MRSAGPASIQSHDVVHPGYQNAWICPESIGRDQRCAAPRRSSGGVDDIGLLLDLLDPARPGNRLWSPELTSAANSLAPATGELGVLLEESKNERPFFLGSSLSSSDALVVVYDVRGYSMTNTLARNSQYQDDAHSKSVG